MHEEAFKYLFESLRKRGFSGSTKDFQQLLYEADYIGQLSLMKTFFTEKPHAITLIERTLEHLQRRQQEVTIFGSYDHYTIACSGPKTKKSGPKTKKRVFLGMVYLRKDSIRWCFYNADGMIDERTLTLA